MNIGDYVRTKKYGIRKILDIGEYLGMTQYLIDEDGTYTIDSSIIKSSPNIIDLIFKDDFVNGRKVYQVGYNFQDDLVLKMSINKDGTINNYEDFIYEKDIKSIVTKEQFSQMEYKVGE